MKILITGATGFIGQELGKALVRDGHEIFAISRDGEKAKLHLSYPATVIETDLMKAPPLAEKLAQIEAVVHLAGENIGETRWSNERKEKILRSRTQTSENLIKSLPESLKVFVGTSAVGFYGDRGSEILNEKSAPGSGFLSEVCQQWEHSELSGLSRFSKTRAVIFRCGVVFGPFGGALMKMIPAFQMNVAGKLGSGEQWMSWIHVQDLVSLYRKAVQDSGMQGIYNAVAPEPITNAQFTKELAQSLKARAGFSAPKFALKIGLGEMSQLLLSSQRVHNERLADFAFRFPDLKSALQDCVAPYKDGDQVLYAEQYLPFPRDQVFKFFAKAENLESITPPLLKFHIQKMSTAQVEKGTLIDYRLKIRGVPLGWQTRIDEWSPPQFFVDTQLKGPYKKWHHTHSFEELGAGTLMTDQVRYRMPFGFAGSLVGPLVRKDVEGIFDYRRKTVLDLIKK